MFQMGGIGPMFGQIGYFNVFAGAKIEDKRALQRFAHESRRLMTVLEDRLAGRDWLMDDYSIADIATVPWVRQVVTRYQGADLIGWSDFTNMQAYLDRFLARPAVQAVLSKV
jgi:GST-like protein